MNKGSIVKKNILFAILILVWLQSFAQWRSPIMTYLGPDEGLMGRVIDMDQDAVGFMYFATDQGMYKYDGSSFQFFGHDPSDSSSISPGQVFDILISYDQQVWLALYKSGLNRYDPRTNKFYRYDLPEHNLSDLSGALSLAEDENGNIWVGGYHARLYKFDRLSEIITTFSPDWIEPQQTLGRRYDFTSLKIDHLNPNLLWATILEQKGLDVDFPNYGIVSFDISEGKFNRHRGAGKIKYQDENGHLWSGIWADMITEYDPALDTCIFHSYRYLYNSKSSNLNLGGGVSFDIQPYEGKLLVASDDILQKTKNGFFDFFSKPNSISQSTSLFVDKSSNLWVGQDQGVKVLSKKNNQIEFYSLSAMGVEDRIYPGRLVYQPLNHCVYVIASTPKSNKCIYKIPLVYDRETKAEWIKTNFLPNVIGIGEHYGISVIGDQSLYELNSNTDKISISKKSFKDGHALPKSYYLKNKGSWQAGVGSYEFYWWHNNQDLINAFSFAELGLPIKGDGFGGFDFGNEGEVILYTRNKLFSLDLISKSFYELTLQGVDTKELDYLTCMMVEEGNIWVSTLSTIYQFEREDKNLNLLKRYTLKDGIVSSTITSFHIDLTRRMWIFTSSGMNGLDIESGEIKYFGTRSGLPIPFNDPIQIIQIPDGRVTTVSDNGLIIFHSDSLWKSVDPPDAKVILKEIQLNGKLLKRTLTDGEDGVVDLPKGQKVLHIKYQALAFPNDKRVSYKYRLPSVNLEWIAVGNNNSLTLSDVPYGNFSVEISASSNPEVSKQTIQFFNPTPFSASKGFPFFLISGVGLISFIFYKWRISQIKKKEKEKTRINKKMADLELTALRSQMNPHFMFNSLNSIKSYVLEAKPEIAADYLSRFSHLIRRILHNSREKNISLNEEIETLDLYLSLEQFRFENAFQYKIEKDHKLIENEITIPPMLLQPFIENAIWHGLMHKKEAGRLLLNFELENGNLKCIIDDNGIGRRKAKELKSLSARKHKSMGLSITQNRVQLMNSLDSMGIEIEIIDKMINEVSEGTKIILTIPLHQNN